MSELAIYEIRDGAITEEYHTLLNPGRRIPPKIEVVTGITNEMVAAAPAFEHVAGEVAERLEGRIFVAHNVRFDWGFVSRELVDALGEAPRVERLCTVQLARKLLPRVRRRNLDALASHFDIRIHPRHRAHGDALATARILLRLLDEASTLGGPRGSRCSQGLHAPPAPRAPARQGPPRAATRPPRRGYRWLSRAPRKPMRVLGIAGDRGSDSFYIRTLFTERCGCFRCARPL